DSPFCLTAAKKPLKFHGCIGTSFSYEGAWARWRRPPGGSTHARDRAPRRGLFYCLEDGYTALIVTGRHDRKDGRKSDEYGQGNRTPGDDRGGDGRAGAARQWRKGYFRISGWSGAADL